MQKHLCKGKQLKDFLSLEFIKLPAQKLTKVEKKKNKTKLILTRIVQIYCISICILKDWLVLWCNSLMWMLSAAEESRPPTL